MRAENEKGDREMAIRVQLQDAKIQIGGGFEAALAWVKAQPGRRYDAATKTWAIPMSLAELRRRCTLPLDVVDAVAARPQPGSHITRYGNAYSAEEWQAKRAEMAAEERIARASDAKLAALRAEAVSRLMAAGVAPEAARMLVGRLLELDVLEESGAIIYSSEERRQAVHEIAEWYGAEVERIAREAEDEADAERERIWRHLR